VTSVALESIVAIDGQQRLKRLGAACVVLFVCVVALHVTGFFDAQRFIEGGPAIQQLASEMVPPNFERWEHWVIPLRDTLAMSIAGTALTVLASLPLGPGGGAQHRAECGGWANRQNHLGCISVCA